MKVPFIVSLVLLGSCSKEVPLSVERYTAVHAEELALDNKGQDRDIYTVCVNNICSASVVGERISYDDRGGCDRDAHRYELYTLTADRPTIFKISAADELKTWTIKHMSQCFGV